MAVPVLSSIDFSRTELLNARLQNLGVDPTGLTETDRGLFWIDGGGNIKFWDGASVQTLGLSTGGNAETLDGNDSTFYLDRANHTGTQVAATISDLPEAVQDAVGSMLSGTQTNITVAYDDATGTLSFDVPDAPAPYITAIGDSATLDLSVTGGALSGTVIDSPTVDGQTPANLRDRSTHTGTQPSTTISDLAEAVQDIIGDALDDSATVNVTYDDATNTVTFAVLNSPTVGGQTPAQLRARSSHTGTQPASTISDFAEAVQDAVGTLLGDSATVDVTYDDAAGTLTLAVLDSPTVGGVTPAQLRDRASHTGAQPISTVTGLQGALDAKADDTDITALDGRLDTAENDIVGLDGRVDSVEATLPDLEEKANKGVANGYAALDGTGRVPSNQLPPLALTDVHVVADLVARDALTAEEGDVAIVQSEDASFIYDGTAWQEMVSPTDGVTAVTGGTGIDSTGGTTPEISITPGGVGTDELATDAVTAAKMADGSVGLNTATTTGTLPVGKGGTGATTAAAARTAIGATTKYATNIGGATDIVVTHNLNTRDVDVSVYRNTSPWDSVIVDVERTTLNTVTVRFATAPAADAFRCVVVG